VRATVRLKALLKPLEAVPWVPIMSTKSFDQWVQTDGLVWLTARLYNVTQTAIVQDKLLKIRSLKTYMFCVIDEEK
jgi:hypothetical protein